MRSNIDKTRRALEQHPEIEQVHLDGAPGEGEAFVRCLTPEYEISESIEHLVDELPNVEIDRTKWLGFAREVILR